MKLFVNMFPLEEVEEKMKEFRDMDLSIFIDYIPQNAGQLSAINVLVLQEPNEYFGWHDWAISNQSIFNLILTWDDKVLNNCPHAQFLPFGGTWFKEDQYTVDREKKFEVAHLRGRLLKTYGHSLRHELSARENEIKMIPTRFFDVYGDRQDIEKARIGKEKVFANSQFNIAIENTSHEGYFTEKILDCFLLKSIPIYWGCSNIEQFFNIRGIIPIKNIDYAIYMANLVLDKNYYENRLDAINENYESALRYVDYLDRIYSAIYKEIIKNENYSS